MKPVYLIVFLAGIITINNKLVAQEYYQASVRTKSLAGITACISDGWSVFGNQAGMIPVNGLESGISCSNYFMLKELALKSAFVALPYDKNVFAVSFYRFGNKDYNENKVGLGFSKEIMPGFSAGFQFNYLYIHFPENDKSPGDFSIEGGIQYYMNQNLVFGAHYFNPFQSGIKTASFKYKIPCLFRFGTGYRVNETLFLACEFEKDLQFDIQTKFGVEYKCTEHFWVRGGLAGNPELYSLGIGYSAKRLTTDFAWQYNYRLGNTPSVAISYLFR